jgi:hypothetical protein
MKSILMTLKSKQISVLLLLIFLPVRSIAQQPGMTPQEPVISFGVHADPLISWFSSDIDSVRNDGARAGINFGISVYRYIGPNYSFSTGISIISSGGRLVSRKATNFDLSTGNGDLFVTVPANQPIVYKIQYLSIPLGLRFQTNQIGYITIFTDLGVDPKVVIGAKVDIPSNDIENHKAPEEVKDFNFSYHIAAGIEYSMGGNTEIVLGLGFENNFADITSDDGGQFQDKISQRMISLKIGVNF